MLKEEQQHKQNIINGISWFSKTSNNELHVEVHLYITLTFPLDSGTLNPLITTPLF